MHARFGDIVWIIHPKPEDWPESSPRMPCQAWVTEARYTPDWTPLSFDMDAMDSYVTVSADQIYPSELLALEDFHLALVEYAKTHPEDEEKISLFLARATDRFKVFQCPQGAQP